MSPDERQVENSDQNKLMVEDTTSELQLSGNDVELNCKKNPQPDEKVLSCARH